MIPDSSRHMLLLELHKHLLNAPKAATIRRWSDWKVSVVYEWLCNTSELKPPCLRHYARREISL